MTSRRRFFSGKTIDDARGKASRALGIPIEDVQFKEIEKTHGFSKVRRNVVIEALPQGAASADSEVATHVPSAPRRTETPTIAEVPVPEVSAPEVAAAPPAPEPVREPAVVAPPPEDDLGGHAGEPRGRRRRRGGRDEPAESSRREATPPPREMPREVAREAPRETPRDTPREAPREVPREAPRETPRQAPSREVRPSEHESRGPVAAGRDAKALEEAVYNALDSLLDLADLDIDGNVDVSGEFVEIELKGRDRGALIEDDGRLIMAIQHLLPRVLWGLTGEGAPCRVDSEGFRALREERLRDIARQTAEDVRRDRRPQQLQPLSPDARRIVHMELENDPEVETVSHGGGFYKRVTVRPTRGDGGRDEGRGNERRHDRGRR